MLFIVLIVICILSFVGVAMFKDVSLYFEKLYWNTSHEDKDKVRCKIYRLLSELFESLFMYISVLLAVLTLCILLIISGIAICQHTKSEYVDTKYEYERVLKEKEYLEKADNLPNGYNIAEMTKDIQEWNVKVTNCKRHNQSIWLDWIYPDWVEEFNIIEY